MNDGETRAWEATSFPAGEGDGESKGEVHPGAFRAWALTAAPPGFCEFAPPAALQVGPLQGPEKTRRGPERAKVTAIAPGRRAAHRAQRGFTLIELLIVVAIIAILAAIAVPNFLEARERALRSANMTNLKALGTALQTYVIDCGKLPPEDQEAGPFESHTAAYAHSIRNGPAGGGSWDGVPWLLVDLKYVSDWHTLFCTKYMKLYQGGKTLRGDWPRYHNFRYAYNTNALGSVLSLGRGTDSSSDNKSRVWLLRDLYLPASKGWFARNAPGYPGDYKFPWGAKNDVECVLYSDLTVKLVKGGTDTPAIDMPEN